MCDHIDPGTNRFNLFLKYAGGSEIAVPVQMPELDYYNMYVSQEYDRSVDGTGNNGRRKDLLAFDEVLQTTLNWAIMLHYDTLFANPAGKSFSARSGHYNPRGVCLPGRPGHYNPGGK